MIKGPFKAQTVINKEKKNVGIVTHSAQKTFCSNPSTIVKNLLAMCRVAMSGGSDLACIPPKRATALHFCK